jgi:hypothetical protein
MSRGGVIKKAMLIGSGVGLSLYAIYGFMEGLLLGGTAGLIFCQEVFGPGVIEINGSGLITRVILGGAMLSGALVSLLVFLVAGGLLGAACGYVLTVSAREKDEVRAEEVENKL